MEGLSAGQRTIPPVGNPDREHLPDRTDDFAARKLIDAEVRKSLADLEDFFENAPVAMHWVGADGIVLRANRAELDLLGYSREEYVGRHIREFHADRETIDEMLARLSRGEKFEKHPARLRAKDGSIKHTIVSSSAQFRDGEFINTRCVTLDVTAERLAEAALRERERESHALLEALPAAVYTTDAKGRISYFNKAAAELAGREPTLGSDEWCVTWKLYWPDGTPLPHSECPMALALKEQRPNSGMEAVAERPDGTRVPFIPYPAPLFDESGKLTGAVNMLVDISERKAAEAALRESEERLRFATEAADVGLWDLDLVNDILFWPARVKAMFGISADVPISMADFYAGLHPEDRERTSAAFAEALDPDRRALYDVEYRTVGKEDGIVRWIAAKGRGIFDGNGTCIRVVGTAIDITGRKQAEQALRRQTDRSEALNRIAKLLSSDLDLERIIQTVTDSATELSGAKFGAFFHNVTGGQGESYLLYTLSGAPREAFEKFAMPRNTAVFGPTFRGEGIVRSDDIRADPRYGKSAPHHGMPKGHLPVVSYLAVPVVSRSGEVHGGLFFAHDQPGAFTQESEDIVAGIAAHAAIAIDNGHSFKAAQTARRLIADSEERFRSLFNSAPVAVFVCDRAGIIQSYNARAAQLWGREPVCGDPTEINCGSMMLRLPDGTPLPHAQSPIVEVLHTGEPCNGAEVIIERPDGSQISVLVNFAALKDPQGEITGAVTSFIDITERKQAEQARRDIEARFQVLADNMPALCWMANPDGWIFWYNRRWYEYTGMAPETQEGWGWESVHDPQVLPAVMDRWKASIASGEPFEMTFPLKGADGVFRPFLTRIVPLRDEKGGIVYWLGTNTDIAKEHEAAERQRLLLAEMSHRVKNLFAIAGSLVALSARSARTPQELAAAVQKRLEALTRAHELTRPGLISTGDLAGQDTTLHALIATLFAPYANSRSKGHKGTVVTGPDLAIGGNAVTNVALVLHELATNAAKYGALSSPEGVVHIDWRLEGEGLLLTWKELGGPPLVRLPDSEGFGGKLMRQMVADYFNGSLSREWRAEGLLLHLSVPVDRLST